MSLRLLFVVAAAGLMAAPRPAAAAFLLYTDRPSFSAAAPGLTTIDFNNQIPSGSLFIGYPGATVTLSGVTFTGSSALFTVAPAYFGGYGLGDGPVLSWQFGTPNRLSVALPAGVSAVGFEFGGFSLDTFTFTLSSGEVITLPGNAAGGVGPASFFGVRTSSPITGLTVEAVSSDAPQLDRFSFGSAALATVATPVPPTAWVLAAAAGGLAVLRRRRAGF